MHGIGVLVKKDRYTYKGYWFDGKMSGKFIVTNEFGQTQTIYYNSNEVISY